MEEFRGGVQEDQQDLFTSVDSETRSDKFRAFLRSRRGPSFSVGLELLTAALAVTLVLLVAAFFMGFLRGKAVQELEISRKVQAYRALQQKSPPVTLEYIASRPVEVEVERFKPAPRQSAFQAKKKAPKPIAKQGRKPYTIQVIAYRSEDRALSEASRLNRKGYLARMIMQGRLYVVCVGEYANRSEAQKDMAALKRIYDDSFLRKF